MDFYHKFILNSIIKYTAYGAQHLTTHKNNTHHIQKTMISKVHLKTKETNKPLSSETSSIMPG